MVTTVLGVFDSIANVTFAAFKKVFGLVVVTAIVTSVVTAMLILFGYALLKM